MGQYLQAEALIVSIRAPVRGRTRLEFTLPYQIFGFNPRPREGANRNSVLGLASMRVFQSAPP